MKCVHLVDKMHELNMKVKGILNLLTIFLMSGCSLITNIFMDGLTQWFIR